MHPHDVRPDEIDVVLAVKRIKAATTFDLTHVRRTWAGLRTFSPDRLPVVGFDSEKEGFFWLGGQGGYGIMTSPAMARLAAELIVNARPPESLEQLGFNLSQLRQEVEARQSTEVTHRLNEGRFPGIGRKGLGGSVRPMKNNVRDFRHTRMIAHRIALRDRLARIRLRSVTCTPTVLQRFQGRCHPRRRASYRSSHSTRLSTSRCDRQTDP